MKQSNNQVWQYGAGRDNWGASVLASLVPAVTQRNGSVCVIVSGRSRINRAKRRLAAFIEQLADAGARFIPRVDIAETVRLQRVKRSIPRF